MLLFVFKHLKNINEKCEYLEGVDRQTKIECVSYDRSVNRFYDIKYVIMCAIFY